MQKIICVFIFLFQAGFSHTISAESMQSYIDSFFREGGIDIERVQEILDAGGGS